jgi:predicted membrane GTPase involved in stress response
MYVKDPKITQKVPISFRVVHIELFRFMSRKVYHVIQAGEIKEHKKVVILYDFCKEAPQI